MSDLNTIKNEVEKERIDTVYLKESVLPTHKIILKDEYCRWVYNISYAKSFDSAITLASELIEYSKSKYGLSFYCQIIDLDLDKKYNVYFN